NMVVGGRLNQGGYSRVGVHSLITAPGVYNLTNGYLSALLGQRIGSNKISTRDYYLPGVFNHHGGTNSTPILVVEPLGEYEFFGGYLAGNVRCAGRFKQFGGTLFSTNLTIQAPGQSTLDDGFLQTGGTNLCSDLSLIGGLLPGISTHANVTLVNGLLAIAGPLWGTGPCNFTQFGGTHTNAGATLMGGARFQSAQSVFTLSGG